MCSGYRLRITSILWNRSDLSLEENHFERDRVVICDLQSFRSANEKHFIHTLHSFDNLQATSY